MKRTKTDISKFDSMMQKAENYAKAEKDAIKKNQQQNKNIFVGDNETLTNETEVNY